MAGHYPKCSYELKCMGCHETTADYCISCFNWDSSLEGARKLSSGSCKEKLVDTLVGSCKYYIGTNDGVTQTYDNCMICIKDFLNWNNDTSTVSCSNESPHKTICFSTINNCEQTVCYEESQEVNVT